MGRVVLGGKAVDRANLALGEPIAWRRLADASRVLRDNDVGEADEEADRANWQDHAVRDGSRRWDVAARQDLERLANRYHAAGGDRLVDGQIGSRRRTPARPAKPHGGPLSWEWSRQMLQSAASSRTKGKGGQPSAVRDEGGDTGVYPGSAPRRVKTYSC